MSTGTLIACIVGAVCTILAALAPSLLAYWRARRSADGAALQGAIDRGRAAQDAATTEAGRALRDSEARLAAGRSAAMGDAADIGRDRLDGKLP